MFSCDQYQLLDFGDGRRLERFGGIVLDRPCPAADHLAQADPDGWARADARFERGEGETGQWVLARELPERWTVAWDRLYFELKRTEFGHLGLFPEQAENWEWIAGQGHDNAAEDAAPLRVLNLFAYTGGSTLAAAAAGAEVVHVDAAKNIVAWARRNAELSGLADRPIRWIVEDALKFVKRELRRGSGYDAVILDPPSYGHGPHGEVWRLAKDLPRLLHYCGQLTAGRCRLMLLTCHTPGLAPERLEEMVLCAVGNGGTVAARPLEIPAPAGRVLPCGLAVRWQAEKGSVLRF